MNRCFFVYLVTSLLVFSIDHGGHVDCKQLNRLRGVPLSKISIYNPASDFECLDGSRIISFDRFNDDYCDCGDGSDEPGTTACPNGVFFCENVGHTSRYVPSGRVNDGVCDCCDGSDEWGSEKRCDNICSELGKEAKKAAETAAELAKEGNKIRLEMSAAGKRMKSENQARLMKLRADYEEATKNKSEKEVIKNLVEEKEKAALEKYKPAEPEQPTQADVPMVESEEYFKMLDSDESGTITIAELKTRVTFDKDRNGEVSEEEALFFLNNKQEVTFAEFADFVWPIVKPFVMKEHGSFQPPRLEEEAEVPEDHEESQDHPTDEDIETDGEDGPNEDGEDEEEPEKQPEVQYNEETQALIDEANAARERYQEAEKSCLELQNHIRSIEEKVERDYGPDDVFSSLDGECYKFRDLEYEYSLCPFGRASQRSISGGSDVNLGHFHDWAGPETSKYSKMKYDRGLACWNGPARNTVVNLRCGTENRLISVSEPSRCEYMMELTTPALCNAESERHDTRDEL